VCRSLRILEVNVASEGRCTVGSWLIAGTRSGVSLAQIMIMGWGSRRVVVGALTGVTGCDLFLFIF